MSKVKYALEDGVAVITMNDPATLNAIDTAMVDGLVDAFTRATKEARCAVLTGEGRGFSSGANLSSGRPPTDETGEIDLGQRLQNHYNPFVTMLRDLSIPWITAVNGAAAGIGCSYALLGDLIVAAESAYFLQAFRRIGLVPDGGSTYLLPRMLTRAQAMEMMLLGEKLPAAKALEWGLINRCVPDAELMPTAFAIAQELARGPTKTLAMIRKLSWNSLDTQWKDQLQAERETQRLAGRTKDFSEGVAAFLQKRPAKFTGE
jgi:2-(1,2-epoxy-1,2-dihydrophenyl)acetyl-CoA isomerase